MKRKPERTLWLFALLSALLMSNVFAQRSSDVAPVSDGHKELTAAVTKQFEARQRQQLKEIESLKDRLEVLKRRVASKEAQKEKLIAGRVQAILNGKATVPVDQGKIRPGDILGVFVSSILDTGSGQPSVLKDPGAARPATGFPIGIRADGSISLPLIRPVNVGGLSLAQAEAAIMKQYVEQEILDTKKANVILSFARRGPAVSSGRLHRLETGDIVGVCIPRIMGAKDFVPDTIPASKDGRFPPSIGLPLTVRDDGTIPVVFLGAVGVRGKTLEQAERYLRKKLIEDEFLDKNATVLVSLARPASSNRTREASGAVIDTEPFSPSSVGSIAKPATPAQSPDSFLRRIGELRAFFPTETSTAREALLRQELDMEIAMAKERVSAAKLRVLNAKEELAYGKRMAKRGYHPPNIVRKSNAQVASAEAEVTEAEARLAMYMTVKAHLDGGKPTEALENKK